MRVMCINDNWDIRAKVFIATTGNKLPVEGEIYNCIGIRDKHIMLQEFNYIVNNDIVAFDSTAFMFIDGPNDGHRAPKSTRNSDNEGIDRIKPVEIPPIIIGLPGI